MTPNLSCEEARDLASEMALGTIAGDDRARLIAHIASCSECRQLVEDLSRIADSILLLGPEQEPPEGFETAVLAQFRGPRPNRLRWIVTAAAATAIVLVSAGGVLWATAADRDLASHYRQDLAEAGGEYFGVKPIRTVDGTKAGNLFAYEGHPSWVFVVFDDSVEAGGYTVDVINEGGGTTSLGSATIGPDDLTWGADLSSSLRDVAAVRFTSPTGEALEARF